MKKARSNKIVNMFIQVTFKFDVALGNYAFQEVAGNLQPFLHPASPAGEATTRPESWKLRQKKKIKTSKEYL